MLAKVETIITFLDCDQAKWYLQKLEYKLKFEDIFVDDITLREFYTIVYPYRYFACRAF